MKKSGFTLVEMAPSLGVFVLMVHALLPLSSIIYRQADGHCRRKAVVQCARNIVETRLSDQGPKDSCQVRGRNYQLKEGVLEKRDNLILYQ